MKLRAICNIFLANGATVGAGCCFDCLLVEATRLVSRGLAEIVENDKQPQAADPVSDAFDAQNVGAAVEAVSAPASKKKRSKK